MVSTRNARLSRSTTNAVRGLAAALLLIAVAAGPAQASRAPTKAEAKAIKKGFLKGREGKTTIRKIRVSTVDERFASVAYKIEDPTAARAAGSFTSRAGGKVPAPTPAIQKRGKGAKWKSVPKAPKKVKKDLKVKGAKSDIQISGEYNALLTGPGRCGKGGNGATIYDQGTDTLLDIQFHGNYWKGPGAYPALAVGSVAGIYADSGLVLLYETGQPSDAFASSGVIYVDPDGWGLIDAYMSPAEPGSGPGNSVLARGYWICD